MALCARQFEQQQYRHPVQSCIDRHSIVMVHGSRVPAASRRSLAEGPSMDETCRGIASVSYRSRAPSAETSCRVGLESRRNRSERRPQLYSNELPVAWVGQGVPAVLFRARIGVAALQRPSKVTTVAFYESVAGCC